jgi:hypothetical protein
MKNWKTSLGGILLGAVTYLSTTGAQIPQTKNDVWHLVIAALFAGLGLVAKDSNVTGGTVKQ